MRSDCSDKMLLAGNNYIDLRQYSQNSPYALYGAGPISHPPVPRKTAEEIAQEKWRAVVRNRAQSRSYHLNDPFLAGNPLRQRMERAAREAGKDTARDLPRKVPKNTPVYLPQDGVSVEQLPAPPQPKINITSVTGADGVSLSAVNGYFVEKDAPMADILTLLSLAAQDRLRGLVEDARTVAKGRQTGSHGDVPAEWADLAVGNHSESAAPTASRSNRREPESAISPLTVNPRKREHPV